MRNIRLFFLGLVTLFVTSCGAPKGISYFQDSEIVPAYKIAQDLDIRLQEGDKLSIVVHSRDPQLSSMFNLPVQSMRVGYTTTSGGNYQMSNYTVDGNGCIDFPVLGSMKVAGLNRTEVASLVKSGLVKEDLLKEPVVIVEFDNMFINVLGEVMRPGRYALTKDKITVLDALGMAGDLTIQGERKNIKVIRKNGDTRQTYLLDLTKMEELVSSPAFYLQQDDVVYVDPNEYRKRQTTVNGNNMRSTSFYISLASLLTSVAVLLK